MDHGLECTSLIKFSLVLIDWDRHLFWKEDYLNSEAGAMALGDNVFYGNGFSNILKATIKDAEVNSRAIVFGYYVPVALLIGDERKSGDL